MRIPVFQGDQYWNTHKCIMFIKVEHELVRLPGPTHCEGRQGTHQHTGEGWGLHLCLKYLKADKMRFTAGKPLVQRQKRTAQWSGARAGEERGVGLDSGNKRLRQGDATR